MTYMRGHALAEPLVDAVDSRQIATNHTMLVVSFARNSARITRTNASVFCG